MLQEDFYPAAEKILSDIVHIIKNDHTLTTLEIIPSLSNTNKSPIHREERSLGLESWCVQPVYCHAYQCVMGIRKHSRKSIDSGKLNSLLVGVLLINPDVSTFWNMRKDLINNARLDPNFDLRFSSLVLSRKPKSSDVYAHRKWVLQKMMKSNNDDECGLLVNEMALCEITADRYSNNYHAWTHRLWCLHQGMQINQKQFLIRELNWSHSWIQKHVSDYSGFFYRQQVLSHLCEYLQIENVDFAFDWFPGVESAFNELCSSQQICANVDAPLTLKLIFAELNLNSKMVGDFEAHEALWYHRRFALYLFKKYIPSAYEREFSNNSEFGHNGEGVPSEKNKKIESLGAQLFAGLLAYENLFLKRYKTDKTDAVSEKYATRHQQWLTRCFQLNKLPSM